MKRVAIVGQFYPPEPCAASNRMRALAAGLRDVGYEVLVITGFPSFPSGEIAAEYRGKRFVRERHDGIEVVRVWTYASPKLNAITRLLNWVSVALGTTIYLLTMHRELDAIVVSSPPITLALPALVARLRHRVPVIADIRDVFPEVAVQMGEWRDGSNVVRAVGWVADQMYATADKVVCVTERAREEIAMRGVPAHKIAVRPNGFDEVTPESPAAFHREPGQFVIAYVGNMGLATGLDVVIDAAQLLHSEPQLRFILIGGGADAGRLAQRTREAGLNNVEFMGVLPRPQAFGVLSQADACVIPLKPQLLESIPTKMFDAMAVRCPIVLSARGESAKLLDRAKAGIAVEPGNPQALAAALLELRDDAERRRVLAESGERFVREHFHRKHIMADYAGAIAAL